MSGKKYSRRDFQRDIKEQQSNDEKMRMLFFALLRANGRVRIKASDIAALDPRDKIGLSEDQTTGDVFITYEAAASEEPAAPPKIGRIH